MTREMFTRASKGEDSKEGECKTYSNAIQIIWGHWVLGQPGTKSESIFTQRVFVDALEKIRRKGNVTTTTTSITTEVASTSGEKVAESVTSSGDAESTTTAKNETSAENETTTEKNTTSSGEEAAKGDTTSDGISTRKRYISLEKNTKKDAKVSTKKNRPKGTTQAWVTKDISLVTQGKYQTEKFFADKRELPNLSYVTIREPTYTVAAEIFPKLSLVQQNLNEILNVLNDYLTPTVATNPTTRKYLFLKPVIMTIPQTSSSTTIQTKEPLLRTTSKPLTTKVRFISKLPVETLSTQRKRTKSTPVPTKSSISALQNILDRLDNLDKRLNKFIDATETTTSTVSPLTTTRKIKKRKRAS